MRESAAFEADLKSLNDDLKQAAAENRATIQKEIETVKKQIKVVQDQAKARLDQAKAETDAKVKALRIGRKPLAPWPRHELRDASPPPRQISKCDPKSLARPGH